MRLIFMVLAVAGALIGQQAPSPAQLPPSSSSSGATLKGPPIPGDALGMSVRLEVTGRILLEDRQPPPEPLPVEYSCRGSNASSATDTKGRFAIIIGRQQVARSALATALPELDGCRVQVRVPGFQDAVATLRHAYSRSDLNIGDLILKSSGDQGKAVFSDTGRSAPKQARESYVRALECIGLQKYSEAVGALDKAIRLYPRHAAALQLKGQVLELMGEREAARSAYQQAVAADSSYGKPLIQLAEMAAADQNSAEAAQWAAKVNHLVPEAYPAMYLLEGNACFNLGRYDDARKAALAGLEADRTDFYPGLHRLLGEILCEQRDYAGAFQQFSRFLKDAPDAPDVDAVAARAESCRTQGRLARD